MALVFRPESDAPGDQRVAHGEWEVGLIDRRFAGTDRYIWHLNRVPGGPDGLRLTGVADTFEEAEAELRKCWRQWLAWADLEEAAKVIGRLTWQGAGEKATPVEARDGEAPESPESPLG
jgi:hypothetical protein